MRLLLKNSRKSETMVGRYWLLAAILLWLPVSSQADHHEVPVGDVSSKADVKFGLDLEQRKAVFLELAAAENRAEQEAAAAFEKDPESAGQVNLAQELGTKYKAGVAAKHGLTMKQAVEISAEGFARSWPAKLP
jgi:hypothetical protein